MIFKNLLPAFKQKYQMKEMPNYEDPTLKVIERFMKSNYRWIFWLEVFLMHPPANTNQKIKQGIMMFILDQPVPELWQHETYVNIKAEISSLMKEDDWTIVFNLMGRLLGAKGEDNMEPIIAFMAHNLGNDFMYQMILKPLSNFIEQYRSNFSKER